ncbi:ATPase AAA-type core domain-containing protein [Tumidithrix helvetica PCC 7403]|uniref:AAA family ATPase n=1 Tax=Tumidithrix helvetica TaxID=3457545 RepID=UPI003CAF1FB8
MMTLVFDSLQISGYRGFQMLDLQQLGQVNIFVGNNNSGKTSLLEAISILCNPLDPFQWLEVSQRRLYLGRSSYISLRPNLEAVKWIFPKKIDSSNNEFYQSEILIEASGSTPIHRFKARLGEIYGSGVEKPNQESFNEEVGSPDEDTGSPEINSIRIGVEIEIAANIVSEQVSLFPSDPEHIEVFQFWEDERFVQRRRNKPLVKSATIFPSYSSEPILDRLTRIILQEKNGKSEVLELIQWFDDNILDIQILSTPTARAVLYIEHKELGFAPLYTFGDGFKRTLVIALTLLTNKNGVLLIDEIETSIHVSALSKVFSWIVKSCRHQDIQLFVTTHSLEAIDAMLQADVTTDDVVAFRLNPKGQAPQRFSGSLLHRLRSERGLDVR